MVNNKLIIPPWLKCPLTLQLSLHLHSAYPSGVLNLNAGKKKIKPKNTLVCTSHWENKNLKPISYSHHNISFTGQLNINKYNIITKYNQIIEMCIWLDYFTYHQELCMFSVKQHYNRVRKFPSFSKCHKMSLFLFQPAEFI